jgi:hypothetical protein
MKLHLLLLPSLFHLSSAFMAELRGLLTEEACTGNEYADFRHCVTEGVAKHADESLLVLDESLLDEMAFMNHARDDDRRLPNWCSGCDGGAYQKGSFCFTFCGGFNQRRLSEEGTTDMDTSNLRRLQQPKLVSVFENGDYTGNGKAKQVAKATIECLKDISTNHPCLGSIDTMVLTITL